MIGVLVSGARVSNVFGGMTIPANARFPFSLFAASKPVRIQPVTNPFRVYATTKCNLF